MIQPVPSFYVCFQVTKELNGIHPYSMYNLYESYAGIAMNAVGFFCCLLSFIPTCQSDKEISKRRQCFVNPWIIWNLTMVAANIVYIAREFHAHDYSNYSAVTGALVLNAVYHIICAMVGVSYIQSLNEIVSNDIMVIPSYTKSPPYEQTERNDGYVMMAYIPNSEDPPSYSENRDDDQ